MAPALNAWGHVSWYATWSGSSSYTTWLTYDIDNGFPLVAGIYERASSSTPHLVGHPTNIVISHWIAMNGYSSSGAQTYYADTVHGTSFWSWSPNVPAFSWIASGSTGISYMISDPNGYYGYVA